jgi:hypothetical protein
MVSRKRTMRSRLVPVYFKSGRNDEFDKQVNTLRNLLLDDAEILEPVKLGSRLPEAEAVLFPQLVGEAYNQINDIKKIKLPLLVVTSEFGTVAMWDWEIVSFLNSEGLTTFTPYNLELTKITCRALGLQRELEGTKFLVFQDNPGEGFQADIFKRFFWWEDRCMQLIKNKFGITIIKKSFKKLGEEAKQIPDQEVGTVLKRWKIRTQDLSERALKSAIKLYMAVKRYLEADESIKGAGINCLNESHFSDTTPCLAWNMLFQESGIVWACEADIMSLTTKYIIHKSLNVPTMMSNIYPFLMGMAALKHEKIDRFPGVEEPENHLLVAHCGYLGVLPEPFSTEWTLRPKVLAIVDENAAVIDARLPLGKITLVKLDPTLSKMMVVKGNLKNYVQYPGSDCRNGAVIKVQDGFKFMDKFYSHHYCLITGHRDEELSILAKVFDLEIERI